MKTTKRILVLLCLMVVTMGAWANPTMKLTVMNGNTTVVDAQDMIFTSENHWSKQIVISEGNLNANLTFTATYNDGNGGSNVVSGKGWFKVTSETTVTFYARKVVVKDKSNKDVDKAVASCDAMFVSINNANWKALGLLRPSVGAKNNSTIINSNNYGIKLFYDTANGNNASHTYYYSFKNDFQASLCYKINDKAINVGPEFSAFGTDVFQVTLDYEECQLTISTLDSYSLTIGDAGVATLCLPRPATIPDGSGIKAYRLTSNGSTTLTATKVAEADAPDDGNIIPANTPVLINGSKRDWNFVFDSETAAVYTEESSFLKDVEPDDAENVLHGIMAPHHVKTTGFNYVLQNNAGKIGFYKVNITDYWIYPFRAFINLASAPSEARSLSIVFDDSETTGIADVRGQKEDVRGDIFNLSGQRVGKDYKGVVIKNGRKMIQK